MAEWQIIKSNNFSKLPPNESPRPRSRWRWLLLMGTILVFLATIGWLALRDQLAERRTAMREDLLAFIFEEETHRFLGNEARIEALIVRDAPRSWAQAYRQAFRSGTSQHFSGSAELKTIDFDGECALVTVDFDGPEQVRAYCLDGLNWLRAPVPNETWGNRQIVVNVIDGVQLSFRGRDQAFGEALADDLRQVFTELDQWAFLPGAVGSPKASALTKAGSYRDLEIIIEPQDLSAPLVLEEERRIVLNSPVLVLLAERRGLSGEDAVRLALAEALLHRAGPFGEIYLPTLPGGTRFLNAAQTIAAMDLILSAEAQQILFESWRMQLDDHWVSPFFVDLLYDSNPAQREQAQLAEARLVEAELAAYLTVYYIYRSKGIDILPVIIHQLPLANSWDHLFQAILNHSTVVLENEATLFARGELIPTSTPQPRDYLPAPHLPLMTTLLRVDSRQLGGSRLQVGLLAQEEPLIVEAPTRVIFRTRNGVFLPSSCTPPGSELEIEGEWLEVGRRLLASRVTVQKIKPFTIDRAPVDTMAYIVAGEPGMSRSLAALRPNGRLQHLATLSATLQVMPLPVASSMQPYFLFMLDSPNCSRSWFVRYQPGQGITGHWLAPLPPMQWVWRADRQDFLFFRRRGDVREHDIFETDNTLALNLVGVTNRPLIFMGWNVKAEQLVAAIGGTYIGLLDMPSGGIESLIRPYYQPIRTPRLSPDGNWLAYMAGVENLFGSPDTLEVFDVIGNSGTILLQAEAGEGLDPPVWSLYLDQLDLAVLTGPIAEDAGRPATRLLVTSPEQSDAFQLVAQAAGDERFAIPVFCADGALLYRVEENGRYHLRRQMPGFPAETLLTLDYAFQPLACS
jgi:hypothetical protein